MSHATVARWPALPLGDWQDTQLGLQLRAQIVGKTRLALAPMQSHWWQTALYVTSRGLGTSLMPCNGGGLEINLDLLAHVVLFRTRDGLIRTMPLHGQSIAEFYREYMATLRSIDVDVKLWPLPAEMPNPVRFPDDHRQLPYDHLAVECFFHVLVRVDRVLKAFRCRFLGKSSPSHFWWGGFDQACTRFSGQRAPQHRGGIPNIADSVTREAYSHECISAGWWLGTPDGVVQEPAFYAYAYPEPDGWADAPVRPAAARYDGTLREWVLPHAAVIAADDPDAYVMEFLQDTYDTASRLGSWSTELVRE